MKVAWQPPYMDGDSAITAYIIEKQDMTLGFGSWTRIDKVKSYTHEFSVTHLLEGHQYLFRVIAENVHGRSQPLESRNAVEAKSPYSKSIAFTQNMSGLWSKDLSNPRSNESFDKMKSLSCHRICDFLNCSILTSCKSLEVYKWPENYDVTKQLYVKVPISTRIWQLLLAARTRVLRKTFMVRML